jgi:hypothetical protein
LLLGHGAVRATDESTVPAGEHVLLVEAVAVGAAGSWARVSGCSGSEPLGRTWWPYTCHRSCR